MIQNFNEKLGSGGFGTVYRGVDSQGNPVALKIANKDYYGEICKSFKNEDFYLRYLHREASEACHHLIKRIAWLPIMGTSALVLQLEQENLSDYLARNPTMSLFEVSFMTSQVAQALVFLKESGVIHADIKPQNILVSGDGSLVKLADFGAAFFKEKAYHPDYHVQTIWYRSPDVVLELTKTYAIDVWSLAVVITELYLNRCPFFVPDEYNDNEVMLLYLQEFRLQKKIKDALPICERLSCFLDYTRQQNPLRLRSCIALMVDQAFEKKSIRHQESLDKKNALLDLLQGMFAFNPTDRLSIENVLAHPFYSSVADVSSLQEETEKSFDFDLASFSPIGLDFKAYELINRLDDKAYVLKQNDSCLHEDKILRYLQRAGGHTALVKRAGVIVCNQKPTLIFEKEKGTLLDFLTLGREVSLKTILRVGYQLLDVLAFIHKEGIVHANIRPEHILVGSDESQIRLCSFGNAYFQDVGPKIEQNRAFLRDMSYKNPSWQFNNFSEDIWSVACVLAELYIKEPVFLPFMLNSKGLWRHRLGAGKGCISSLWYVIEQEGRKRGESPAYLVSLLKKMFIFFPQNPPSAQELIPSFSLFRDTV